jgi:hypothetical protein
LNTLNKNQIKAMVIITLILEVSGILIDLYKVYDLVKAKKLDED